MESTTFCLWPLKLVSQKARLLSIYMFPGGLHVHVCPLALAFQVDISKLKIVQKGRDTKLVPCVKHKQTWKLIGGQS
jgi:hypothetical protein